MRPVLPKRSRFGRDDVEEANKDFTKQNTRVLVGFRNAYGFDVEKTVSPTLIVAPRLHMAPQHTAVQPIQALGCIPPTVSVLKHSPL